MRITKDKAEQRMSEIAMMPSVVMVGVDKKQDGLSIGMVLDKSNASSDVDELLLGLMTAYVGINLNIGYGGNEIIERSAKTLIAIIKKLTKDDKTAVTVH